MMKKISIVLLLLLSGKLHAVEYKFSSALVWGGGSSDEIIYSTELPEGIQSAKFLINSKRDVILDNVLFKKNKKTGKVEAFLSPENIEKLGIHAKDESNTFLSDIDENIIVKNIGSDGVIRILVPQWLMLSNYNDISPEQWSNGNSSVSVNYNLGYFLSKYKNNNENSLFYNSQVKGTTEQGFIFKSDFNVIKSPDGHLEAKNNYYTVQKDIKSTRSRLIIGKQFSDGYFFEPYKLTGVIFANSKDMWPESEYMFKPSIDGIVSQPSIIEIYQNNVLIKKEEVQSGKYEINDYNPLYYGGDLEVNVKDGSGKVITKYTVPYTAGSLFVNKNNFLYKFTAGRLSKNNSYSAELDNVYEAGVLYGLSDAVNLRYGYLHAERYNSLLNGLSVNSVIGLMSLDIQMSASRPISDEKTYSGFNLKTTYQKDLNWYNISNVVLSNNIYNAKSHRSLSQTYSKNNDSLIKQDSSIQLNGNVFNGSINFGGGLREYWDTSRREKYLSAGYNGRYNIVNYNFSVFRTDNDTTTLFNVQIPFGRDYNNNVLLSYISNNNGLRTKSANYNKILPENNASFGIGVSEYNDNKKNVSASLNYWGDYFSLYQTLNGNNDNALTSSTNINGSVIYVDDNYIFTKRLSDTVAIIKADGMKNAKVNNSNSILNSKGYGEISLSPYRRNLISINSENTPLNVNAIDRGMGVIPVKDSISLINIKTESQESVFVKFNIDDLADIKFSSPLYNDNNEVVGNFTQGNYILIKELTESIYFYKGNAKCYSKLFKTNEKLLGLDVYKASICN